MSVAALQSTPERGLTTLPCKALDDTPLHTTILTKCINTYVLNKAHFTIYYQSVNMGYKCNECKSSFSEKINVKQHLRKEHELQTNISVIIVISIPMIKAIY